MKKPSNVLLWALAGALLLGLLAGCGGPSEPPAPPERVWILGVESLDLRHLRGYAEGDELAAFSRVLEGGAVAELTAHLPLESASLWTTLLTGKGPQKHGVLSQLTVLPDGRRAMTPSSLRKVRSLWQILGEKGMTSASVNFPATWPSEVVNGFLVTNGFTRTRWTETVENTFPRIEGHFEAYPKSLWQEIRPLVQDPAGLPREVASRFFTLREEEFALLYDRPLGSVYRRENPLKDFALTYQSDRSAVDIALMLDERYDPRVTGVYVELLETLEPVFGYFAQPDRFLSLPQDSVRRYGRTVEEGFRFVDEQLGRILERLGPRDLLIVMSDRGYDVRGGLGVEGEPVEPTPVATDEACVLFYGQGIAAGATGRGVLADVTPTLLTLLGVGLGADMDGRVLRELIDPAFLEAHPPFSVETHDAGWNPEARYSADEGEPLVPGRE